jgi:hypothetical protein
VVVNSETASARLSAWINAIAMPAYPNLWIRTGADDDAAWLQIVDDSLPAEFNSGRKWRISYHACRGEVVQTAFTAVLAWFEHEVREAFLWQGRAIFQPHSNLDVDPCSPRKRPTPAPTS